MNAIHTISRYTFLEAVRNRLFILLVIVLICILGLTEFIGELAITETRQTQGAVLGAGLRLFSVCIVSLFVITTMVREFNDKGFEMLLSLPIPRASYYCGKLLGFFCLSIAIAAAAGIILLLYSQTDFILLWSFSLLCELLIIISLSLLCVFTFSNITVAFMVVMAFYLLSRSMYAIQLISDSPILEVDTFSREVMNFMIDAIAFLLPELNIFTNSSWLTYGVEVHQLLPVLVQTIIYLILLVSAGMFDLYRKNF